MRVPSPAKPSRHPERRVQQARVRLAASTRRRPHPPQAQLLSHRLAHRAGSDHTTTTPSRASRGQAHPAASEGERGNGFNMKVQNAGPGAFGTTSLEAPDRHRLPAAGGQEVPVPSKARADGLAGYPDIIESCSVERRQKCTELSWLPQATISPSGPQHHRHQGTRPTPASGQAFRRTRRRTSPDRNRPSRVPPGWTTQ